MPKGRLATSKQAGLKPDFDRGGGAERTVSNRQRDRLEAGFRSWSRRRRVGGEQTEEQVRIGFRSGFSCQSLKNKPGVEPTRARRGADQGQAWKLRAPVSPRAVAQHSCASNARNPKIAVLRRVELKTKYRQIDLKRCRTSKFDECFTKSDETLISQPYFCVQFLVHFFMVSPDGICDFRVFAQ